jgi:tetratricopeptide (TPR) repeat protein
VQMRAVICLFFLLVITAYSNTYADLFAEAANLSQQGKYELAAAKYESALALHPGAPEALNNLAVMYYQLRRFPDAFRVSSQIWESHPELKSASLVAGMSAIQCNRPKDALAPLRQLRQTDPGNRDGVLALASAYVGLKDFNEAAKIYDEQVARKSEDAVAWYGRAICYESLAENASRELAKTPGGSALSKKLLGNYLASAGNAKLAVEAFGESEALETSAAASEDAKRKYDLARRFADQSRASFEHLLQLAPNSWQAVLFLGDVDRQQGKLVTALEYYRRAASMQPDQPAAMLGMGTVYWQMGDFDHASVELRKVLEVNPSANQAIFELANIAVRHHADAEAVPLLEKFLVLQPDALAAHADLGRAYAHLGENAKAAKQLEWAAPSDERGDIHYELSIALRKLGRIEASETALNRSKELRQAQLEKEQRLHTAH